MTRRAVVDTSTLVGAVIRPGSVPHRAWLLAQRLFEILESPETLSEIALVLHRKQLSRYVNSANRDEFLYLLRSVALLFDISTSDLREVEPSCRDPKDNIFLALAAAGQADVIVSSDHDLLVLHPWRGIPILTPAQFVAQFGP